MDFRKRSIDQLTSNALRDLHSILVFSASQSFSWNKCSWVLHFLRGLPLPVKAKQKNRSPWALQICRYKPLPEKQTWPFQFGSRSKKRYIPYSHCCSVYLKSLPWFYGSIRCTASAFSKTTSQVIHKTFQLQLFALSGERDCFHVEEMTSSLSSLWANQIAENTKVFVSPNRVAASKGNGTKFKCTFFYEKLWTKITCHICVIRVHDPEYSCSVEILLGFKLNSG